MLDYTVRCPVCDGVRSSARDRRLHKQCGQLMQACRAKVEREGGGKLSESEIIRKSIAMAKSQRKKV